MAPDSAENPFITFSEWFEEASHHKDIKEANAVNLATASRDGLPSNRMVLLKDYNEEGFVFYTNLNSHKGKQLKENPFAAMCFYWEPLSKQVRIEGFVINVDAAEADAYFASRPFKSQIGAWASKQSQPLDSQATLLKEIAKQTARFATQDVPRPEHWSGFRLVPCYMEFWQKGEYRLHQRLSYVCDEGNNWKSQLLYP
ncbi:MAG: pyridoxamine 5'-phosphate oxidase [Rickettsiales bacterium]|nr:pyridoxamine 5'-phosphate oxidase [Rickettsiales bacterium]